MTKTALITGASGGIGRAIAIKMAKEGYNIVVHYNGSLENAEVTKQLCEKENVEAITYKCNVADFKEVEKMMADVKEKFNTIDLLVNNSGITKDSLILRMSEADFDDVISVNLKGCFNCIKHVSRTMMRQKSGVIINITSVVGISGNAGQANYAASKAGVIGLTKTIAKELAAINVRCNAVAPGFIQTQMTEQLPENVKEKVIEEIPLKKLGEADDVASVVAFLASDNAKYITGQVISVDGGMTI